jgi:photosystem II stability/assembly factor-like uncharacterized protein
MPAPPAVLNSVSCPSAAVCLAVGNSAAAVKTIDGGANWSQLTLPSNVYQNAFTSISCPSTTTCLAHESGGIVVTTDGGATWTTVSTKPTLDSWAISCPSATICYTGGLAGALAATSDGGNSWSTLAYTVTSAPLTRIKCPSPSTCFAVGNEGFYASRGGPYPGLILRTTDAGRTWAKRYDTSLGGIQDISCPTVSTCFASVGDAILSTTDGGGSWTQKALNDPTFALSGIDCPTTTVCFAVGGMQNNTALIVSTTNGWATWREISSGPFPYLKRVSCANVNTCVAVAYAGNTMRTTDGVNWSPGVAIPTTPYQQTWAIDCPSATACFAIANGSPNQIFASTNGGLAWSPQPSPANNTLWDVDCSSPATCLVTGRGQILSTTNGGSNWGSESGGTANDLLGVDCPATAVCYAVGYGGTILALPPGPRAPWSTQPSQPAGIAPPPGPWYMNGVKPSPVAPAARPAAPTNHPTRLAPSSGGSALGATQADVSRAMARAVNQIARALEAIVN